MSETKTIKTKDIIKGEFSVDLDNKKVIIKSDDTTSNILLEDISSTGMKSVETSEEILTPKIAKMRNIGVKICFVGIIIFIVGFVMRWSEACVWYDKCHTQDLLNGIGAIIAVLGFFVGLLGGSGEEKITIFDQVTIETKGGKDIVYYVDQGQGDKNISSIENARRSK